MISSSRSEESSNAMMIYKPVVSSYSPNLRASKFSKSGWKGQSLRSCSRSAFPREVRRFQSAGGIPQDEREGIENSCGSRTNHPTNDCQGTRSAAEPEPWEKRVENGSGLRVSHDGPSCSSDIIVIDPFTGHVPEEPIGRNGAKMTDSPSYTVS